MMHSLCDFFKQTVDDSLNFFIAFRSQSNNVACELLMCIQMHIVLDFHSDWVFLMRRVVCKSNQHDHSENYFFIRLGGFSDFWPLRVHFFFKQALAATSDLIGRFLIICWHVEHVFLNIFPANRARFNRHVQLLKCQAVDDHDVAPFWPK